MSRGDENHERARRLRTGVNDLAVWLHRVPASGQTPWSSTMRMVVRQDEVPCESAADADKVYIDIEHRCEAAATDEIFQARSSPQAT